MSKITLNTGVWYDRQIDLPVPSAWDIKVLRPATPPPLTRQEMASALENPTGQPSLRELCRGKWRPLLIVDDMNRPTPVSAVMPLVLESISAEGIPLEMVTILMATGTHGQPGPGAMLKKVGSEASACRLLIHDCFNDLIKAGTTSNGTPIFVNKAVLESDIVIGVSGIYPNATAGYGGGSKLALGVLGIRSIYNLHFHQEDIGWGNTKTDIRFRRELDEIARMIGMRTNISLIIDANRQVIKIFCGDQEKYFPEAVSFYHRTLLAPEPDDLADVVISNSYPNDLSLTFAAIKGFGPFAGRKPSVSRIAIAACNEGLGLHNIFPFVNIPRFHRYKHIWRVVSVLSFRELTIKIRGSLKSRLLSRFRKKQFQDDAQGEPLYPIWLFHSGDQGISLPDNAPGIKITADWTEIVKAIQEEQSGRESLKVLVYPCAFLQVLANSPKLIPSIREKRSIAP